MQRGAMAVPSMSKRPYGFTFKQQTWVISKPNAGWGGAIDKGGGYPKTNNEPKPISGQPRNKETRQQQKRCKIN